MIRQYNWAIEQINNGRTVLVYRGVTATKTYHVKTVDRLTISGNVLYVDGMNCSGFTVCVR